jgi:thiosulfate dehydrogenase [quinone] large subunit
VGILFGIAWSIDAQFKRRPGFLNNVVSCLTGARQGQPTVVRVWIDPQH